MWRVKKSQASIAMLFCYLTTHLKGLKLCCLIVFISSIPLKPVETKTETAKLETQKTDNLKQLRGKFTIWFLACLLPTSFVVAAVENMEHVVSDFGMWFISSCTFPLRWSWGAAFCPWDLAASPTSVQPLQLPYQRYACYSYLPAARGGGGSLMPQI